MSAEQDLDLIVVGLGGAGLSAIHLAASLGMNAIGIDAGPPGRGAAASNGGFLLCGASKFYNDAVEDFGREFSEKLWKLTEEELHLQQVIWPDTVKLTGTYRCAGWPYVERHQQPDTYDKDVNHVMEHFLSLRASGIPVELGDIDGTASIFIPSDGWCQPADRLAKVHEAASRAGARLYFDTPAQLDVSSGVPHVITAAGKLTAKNIIVSTDAHLEELFPQLANEVQTWKLQMMSVKCDTDRFSTPTYMRFGYDYVVKTPDGIVLGGFRDIDLENESAKEWKETPRINSKISKSLLNLARLITDKDVEVKTEWSSAVGYSSSGLPVVREMHPGVWACGAYNGHGNILSFLCGKSIIYKILGRESPVFDLLRQHKAAN